MISNEFGFGWSSAKGFIWFWFYDSLITLWLVNGICSSLICLDWSRSRDLLMLVANMAKNSSSPNYFCFWKGLYHPLITLRFVNGIYSCLISADWSSVFAFQLPGNTALNSSSLLYLCFWKVLYHSLCHNLKVCSGNLQQVDQCRLILSNRF